MCSQSTQSKHILYFFCKCVMAQTQRCCKCHQTKQRSHSDVPDSFYNLCTYVLNSVTCQQDADTYVSLQYFKQHKSTLKPTHKWNHNTYTYKSMYSPKKHNVLVEKCLNWNNNWTASESKGPPYCLDRDDPRTLRSFRRNLPSPQRRMGHLHIPGPVQTYRLVL